MIWILLFLLDLPQLRTLPEVQTLPTLKVDEWELVRDYADKHQKPIVLFIRCERRSIPGILTARADAVWGHPGPMVLFGVPRNGKLAWFRAGSDWSVEDIEGAVRYRLNERVAVQRIEQDCPT